MLDTAVVVVRIAAVVDTAFAAQAKADLAVGLVADKGLARPGYKEIVDSYTCIILTLTQGVKLRSRISGRLQIRALG